MIQMYTFITETINIWNEYLIYTDMFDNVYNFFLNSEVPAKFKCNPSLGEYKEESGWLFNKKTTI